MKPSDNEIEMLAAGFSIQHKNGLIRFAHALLDKYAPQANQKPHEVADLVNRLRDIAVKHHGSQQLRERIAHEIRPLFAPQASEAVRAHNDAIEAAAKVCIDIARQYDPQNNQEHALASELYSAALAIRKLEKDGGDCAKGAGDGDLMRFALEAIEVEMDPKWECNSYHPKLRMAAERLRAALSPTPSVVKQSLTATQTGEKGEKDAG